MKHCLKGIFLVFAFRAVGVFADSASFAAQPADVRAYLNDQPPALLRDAIPSHEERIALYAKLNTEPGDFFYRADGALRFAAENMTLPGDYYFFGNGMAYPKVIIETALGAKLKGSSIHSFPYSRFLVRSDAQEETLAAYLKSSGIIERAAKGRVFLVDTAVGGSSLKKIQTAIIKELETRGMSESEAMNRVVPIAIREDPPGVTLKGFTDVEHYLNDTAKKLSDSTYSHSPASGHGNYRTGARTSIYEPMVVVPARMNLETDYGLMRWLSPLSWEHSKYTVFDENGVPTAKGSASQYFKEPRTLDEAKIYVEGRMKALSVLKKIDQVIEKANPPGNPIVEQIRARLEAQPQIFHHVSTCGDALNAVLDSL